MRLLEAIIDANHRAVAGDSNAALHPSDFADQLPMAALTCIDARLNALLPGVLGIPAEQFIWLRNAGNVVSGPLSSTMRSMALACAIKGAKEIAIIGHNDCLVGKESVSRLIDRFRALGIERHLLPENLTEYFGMFASERQNVIKAADIVRSSPLIGAKVPVHGLLLDVNTGQLEWLVNGYNAPASLVSHWTDAAVSARQAVDAFKSAAEFTISEIKFPEGKIGEIISEAERWATERVHKAEEKAAAAAAAPPLAPVPPRIPSSKTSKFRLRLGGRK